jgi:hypothetical protein
MARTHALFSQSSARSHSLADAIGLSLRLALMLSISSYALYKTGPATLVRIRGDELTRCLQHCVRVCVRMCMFV